MGGPPLAQHQEHGGRIDLHPGSLDNLTAAPMAAPSHAYGAFGLR